MDSFQRGLGTAIEEGEDAAHFILTYLARCANNFGTSGTLALCPDLRAKNSGATGTLLQSRVQTCPMCHFVRICWANEHRQDGKSIGGPSAGHEHRQAGSQLAG